MDKAAQPCNCRRCRDACHFYGLCGRTRLCETGRRSARCLQGRRRSGRWHSLRRPSFAELGGRYFKITQLDALEEQVNISNQNVAAAEAQFRQARAAVQAARAGYFPNVSIGAQATRSLGSANAPNSLGTTNQVSDLLLTGTASWEPDVWGKVRRTVEASQAGAQASAADLESIRLSTQAALAQNYFQLCALDAQKKLLDATVAAFQKSLDLTNKRYVSGVSSRADVLQAETQLKTTQAQAIDVGVQRSQLEHAIALLVGKPAVRLLHPGNAPRCDARRRTCWYSFGAS